MQQFPTLSVEISNEIQQYFPTFNKISNEIQQFSNEIQQFQKKK